MGKRLVAYFSASKGKVTERLARELAEASEADLFEIRPQVPYTEADIKWVNPLARCNKEKFGNKEVPVEGQVENMDEYDLIMLGFPIWYGCAPNVVNTFLKGYDLSEKKIAVFATSGGSGIGKTAEKLKPYVAESTKIVKAERMSGSESKDHLKAWADECDG